MSWLSEWMGQDAAKKSGALTDQAIQTAQNTYNAGLAPYRQAASNKILGPSDTASLSSLYGANPTYTPVSDPSMGAATASLASLTNAPDYLSQAKTALKDFQAAAAPQLAAARRGVKQDAASAGRIGAGGVTTSLGNLESDYERNLMSKENELLSGALDKTQANKYATLSAAEGLGREQFGEGVTNEQGRMSAEQQAIDNALKESGLNFGQGMSLAQLGFGQSPTSTELTGADIYGKQSATQAQSFADLMKAAGQTAVAASGG